MLVKDLKKIIENLPDYMEIVMLMPDEDFPNVIIEKAEVKNVRFCEDPDDMDKEPFCDEDCLVLSAEL